MLILASCWTITVCHPRSLDQPSHHAAQGGGSCALWGAELMIQDLDMSWRLREDILCDFCPGSSPFPINIWPGTVLSCFTLLVCCEQYVVEPRHREADGDARIQYCRCTQVLVLGIQEDTLERIGLPDAWVLHVAWGLFFCPPLNS